MSKVIEKEVENQQATVCELLAVIESLKTRMAELDARVNEMEAGAGGCYFVELGNSIIFMRGEEPVFIASRASRDDVAFLFVMDEEETKEALREAKAWLEEKRNVGAAK